MTVVENGCKVVNVDNSELKKLKESINAFDVGMERILEALNLFIDDMEGYFSYEKSIPYEKLFNALKCIIKSAKDSENIRNACVTGIILEAHSKVTNKRTEEVREIYKPIQKRNVILNPRDVAEYAKGKTIQEIADHFGTTKMQIKNFIVYHNIEYKKEQSGRKSKINIDTIRQLAENMTVPEIAKTLMVSSGCIYKCCQRHGIKSRSKRKC